MKKRFPNILSRTGIFPTIVGEELVWNGVVAGLVLLSDAERMPRAKSLSGTGTALLPEDRWEGNPSAENIRPLVIYFMDGVAKVRAVNALGSKTRNPEAWDKSRKAAARQAALTDLLSPLKLTLSANGLGVEMLKHALTGPEARARRAGKSGWTRDELVNNLWNYTLEHKAILPPFVKA